jgi:uncharacterized Zn finger protein (UPF0148 family)
MSGFDEEAERERLREKYERDQEKRANTQRMSELLLKGATMTNSHCDDCGDPIFRHDGREFCPTCRADAGGETDATPETVAAPAGADADADADTETAPDDGSRAADEASTTGTDRRARERSAEPPGRTGSHASPSADGSLDEARASLGRTLVRYAQAAEAAEDPRRATEYLAAAREAAETLAALEF